MTTNDEKFPTPRQTRIGLLVLMPLALLFGQRALVWADVTLPTPTFTDGQPLTAAQLNGNFDALKDAINKPTISIGGKLFSTHAVYKTSTANTKGKFTATGGLVSYEAAKQLCEDAAKSPSAHMCSAEEIQRSRQLGKTPTNIDGWISTGGRYQEEGSYFATDCMGWTSEDQSQGALYFYGKHITPFANLGGCDNALPILCCD